MKAALDFSEASLPEGIFAPEVSQTPNIISFPRTSLDFSSDRLDAIQDQDEERKALRVLLILAGIAAAVASWAIWFT